MNGDLKVGFIQQVLAQYGRETAEMMRQTMRRLKVGETGEGYDSIAYEALQIAAGGTLKLSFKEYLRMVDMGAGRAHPLGGLAAMTVSLAAQRKTGMAQVKDKVRRPKKFYSKVAYGKLGWLYGKLLYGYTEETIELLKKGLTPDGSASSP